MTLLLKSAVQKDAVNIWKWRNEKTTRMNSFNARIIPLSEHMKWFSAALKSKKRRIYIIHNNGKKIGYIRIDYSSTPEIHIAIDKKYRNRGFGKQAIRLACNVTPGIMTAKIKPDNTASVKAFSGAGFKITRKSKSMIIMQNVGALLHEV